MSSLEELVDFEKKQATGRNATMGALARTAAGIALAAGLGMVGGGCSSIGGSAGSIASGDHGITTTLEDAWPEGPWMDGQDLGRPKPLDSLPRDAEGRQILPPGYYSGQIDTY